MQGHAPARTKAADAEYGQPAEKACDCNQDAAPARYMWLVWIAPGLLWFGLCTHSVFEGLAVGLQVGFVVHGANASASHARQPC